MWYVGGKVIFCVPKEEHLSKTQCIHFIPSGITDSCTPRRVTSCSGQLLPRICRQSLRLTGLPGCLQRGVRVPRGRLAAEGAFLGAPVSWRYVLPKRAKSEFFRKLYVNPRFFLKVKVKDFLICGTGALNLGRSGDNGYNPNRTACLWP